MLVTSTMIEITVELILKLRNLGPNIKFKDILHTYLTAEDDEGVIKMSRRYWGGVKGQQSTLIVLKAMQKLICKRANGRKFWKMFILSEAKRIVNLEAGRRWRSLYYPPHVSAKAIKPSFFISKNSEKRAQQTRAGMDFLFQLIRHRLSAGRPETEPVKVDFSLTDQPTEKAKSGTTSKDSDKSSSEDDEGGGTGGEDATDEDASSKDSSLSGKGDGAFKSPSISEADDESDKELENRTIDIDDLVNQIDETDQIDHESAQGDEDDWVDAIEGVNYVQPGDRIEQLQLRFDNTATTVCSMIAFVSRRTVNGLQMENGIAFLAGGVSLRLNQYLHAIGITCSRRTAMRALSRLGKVGLASLRHRVSHNYPIRPFLVVDNFDIQERIHYSKLESTSRMFHGTYGYMHFLNKELTSKVDSKDLTLDSFVHAMREAEDKEVHAKHFLPDIAEREHWAETIKAQLGQAYLDYIATENRTVTPQSLPKVSRKPPPLQPIAIEKADVEMLPLMDQSCGSSEGVGQVLDHIANLTGRCLKDFPDDLQIIEGDVGTCINLESYRSKLHPAGRRYESMINYLTLPGGAHTLWNVGHWQVLSGWGDASDEKDLPFSKGWAALTMKADRPLAKKDFGVIIRIITHLHFATMVWCMREVIKKRDGKTKILDTDTAKSIIEQTTHEYFSEEALQSALKSGDIRGYNLRLRLRDLATYVEADQAAKTGDIGRLIRMWKRWSVMAHGNTGLSHYAQHLPRLVLLLEHYLPVGLAYVIKHAMLISARGASGRFEAKDLHLEHMIYWLKYFFNRAGAGTKIKILADRYSQCLKLLQRILALIRIRAGFQSVYQKRKNYISPKSMQAFQRAADRTFGSNNTAGQPKPLPNLMETGFLKLQAIFQNEYTHKSSSRYRWGSTRSHDIPNANSEDPTVNDLQEGEEG